MSPEWLVDAHKRYVEEAEDFELEDVSIRVLRRHVLSLILIRSEPLFRPSKVIICLSSQALICVSLENNFVRNRFACHSPDIANSDPDSQSRTAKT